MRKLTTLFAVLVAAVSFATATQVSSTEKSVKLIIERVRHTNEVEEGHYTTRFHFKVPEGLVKKVPRSEELFITDGYSFEVGETPEGKAIVARLQPLLPAKASVEVDTYQLEVTVTKATDVDPMEKTVTAEMGKALNATFQIERVDRLIPPPHYGTDPFGPLPVRRLPTLDWPTMGLWDTWPSCPLDGRDFLYNVAVEPEEKSRGFIHYQRPTPKTRKIMQGTFALPGVTAVFFDQGDLEIYLDPVFDKDEIKKEILKLIKGT